MAREIDICEPEGFAQFCEANPEFLLLVTEKGCGDICAALKEVVYKVSDETKIPVVELEFNEGMAPSCKALDRTVAQGAVNGVVAYYKSGKLVGWVKGTGFKDIDEKELRELLGKKVKPSEIKPTVAKKPTKAADWVF